MHYCEEKISINIAEDYQLLLQFYKKLLLVSICSKNKWSKNFWVGWFLQIIIKRLKRQEDKVLPLISFVFLFFYIQIPIKYQKPKCKLVAKWPLKILVVENYSWDLKIKMLQSKHSLFWLLPQEKSLHLILRDSNQILPQISY